MIFLLSEILRYKSNLCSSVMYDKGTVLIKTVEASLIHANNS